MNNIDWNPAIAIAFFDEVGEIEKSASFFAGIGKAVGKWAGRTGNVGRKSGDMVFREGTGKGGGLWGGKQGYYQLTEKGAKGGLGVAARRHATNVGIWASRNPRAATGMAAGGGYLALT